MTDAEKDATWRSLPDGFKKEVSRHYKSWHNSLAFEGECAVLDYLFGKHNLTASEEEKPRFKVGDCVKVFISNNSVYRKGDVCLVMSVIKDNNGYHYELDRSRAMLISEEFLAPYTEEQKLKDGTLGDIANNNANWSGDEREVIPKNYPDLGGLLVDWLAYRMELAKEVVNGLLFTDKSPETIVDETTTIVNGIVERLKGGEK